ncbi:MAG: 4Fe-4S cluster-binding domain-containing protein [Fusobacteriaceae bacterium]|nr:4Fe-4S cluster-binding domain-containing protein [Fusobacteriaceae bacterium]
MDSNKICLHAKNLEINVSDLCNLSCRACSHLSPVTKHKEFDVDKCINSILVLSGVMKFECIRLLGGEPLLSKDLRFLIEFLIKSKISKRLCIATNGTLINEVHDSILHLIDCLDVSFYNSGNQNKTKIIRYLTEKTKQFKNLEVKILNFKYFRESYTEYGPLNVELIDKIYETCLVSKNWQCYNLEEGYFFKCPQAHILSKHKEIDIKKNGVRIVGNSNLISYLKEYLNDSTPLKACFYCLGSVGKLIPHEQVPKIKWRQYQEYHSEELIDYEYMDVLKKNFNADNGVIKNIRFIKNGTIYLDEL